MKRYIGSYTFGVLCEYFLHNSVFFQLISAGLSIDPKKSKAFASKPKEAVNPIGGTFLSRQNMKKLRAITEVCISFSFSWAGQECP